MPAIAQVVAQQQFQRRSPGLADGLRLALDLHSLGRRGGAEGTSRSWPPIRTRHARHDVDGLHPAEAQGGTSMPSFRAASSTVAPSGTSTWRWSMVSLGMGAVGTLSVP